MLLMASADTSSFSDPLKRTYLTNLRRAMIDSEQAFQLHIGIDDFTRTFFFRVPAAWGTRSLVDAPFTQKSYKLY